MFKPAYRIPILAVCIAGILSGPAFSLEGQLPEEKKKPGFVEKMEGAFERAIKKTDQDKLAEQESLKSELKEKLRLSVKEWVLAAQQEKGSEIDKKVKENWDAVYELGPAGQYNYYLRDYAYSSGAEDILKTDSLAISYKGQAQITETLYVEKEHSSSPSFIRDYLYNAVTPIKVNFSYKENKFVFESADREIVTLKKGWPEEVFAKSKTRLKR